jgi:hypothetical protein
LLALREFKRLTVSAVSRFFVRDAFIAVPPLFPHTAGSIAFMPVFSGIY